MSNEKGSFRVETCAVGTLTVADNASSGSQTVNLSGTGVQPVVSFTPTSLSFLNQLAGTTSTQTVTVTNVGTGNLIFGAGAVTLTGADTADFAVSNDGCSGNTVAPKSSCSVSVEFKPQIAGSLSAQLEFTDNGANSPQAVSLSGTSLTTVQYIQDVMIPQVESLGLNSKQARSLVKQLQDAARLISQGKTNGAIGNLEQFIAEVNDLAGSGVLSPTQASMLIGEANSVIKQL